MVSLRSINVVKFLKIFRGWNVLPNIMACHPSTSGMEPAALEAQDKLVWRGTPQEAGDRILFSRDGIHPAKAGGDLYAAAIARAIEKMDNSGVPEARTLPVPLITAAWDEAGMYEPQQIAVFDTSWAPIATGKSKLKQFQGWFDTIMTADKPGASFTFFF